VRTGIPVQPDSLKLAILKLVHRAAFSLEVKLGEKAVGKTTFLKGNQVN
jgi:hypothetical protein